MKRHFRLWMKSCLGAATRKLLGPHVCGVVVRAENGLFVVDPEDQVVGRQLRKRGSYGLDELERLKPHLMPASRVLVVGSHVGALAIPLARFCQEVVAIEANPRNYELLVMNVALNSATNCRAINIAASDKEEKLDFLASKANSGGSKRVPLVKDYMYYYDKPEVISVPAVSLDRHLNSQRFDVVVMDIEGSEYFALKGMQEILAGCQVLVVEYLPHHLRNVAGVTVEQFLSVVAPHFSRLTIPSKNITVGAAEFLSRLQAMYDRNEGDDGILFAKA